MNSYELILLFDANLGEEKIGQAVGKVEEKIKSQSGEIDRVEKWGTRRLASMVKKAKNLTQAYYVLIRFKGPASLIAELRTYLKVTEIIVRYFISRAVATTAASERREITGVPLNATPVGEIRGEPLGESQ